jgi:hypothetical protein
MDSVKMVMIFVWGRKIDKVETINGEMLYRDWLELQKESFISHGRAVEIREKDNRVSLWADDIVGEIE